MFPCSSQGLPKLERGCLLDILDPRLPVEGLDLPSVRRMGAATLMCLRYLPEHRPNMGEVAQLLEADALDDTLVIALSC